MTTSHQTTVYYSKLRLSNVKAFLPGTELDLCLKGSPAPWTLILGENGLGKTTLMQCLALMRPILNVEKTDQTDADNPDRIEPAIPSYADEVLVELARVGDGLQVELEAEYIVANNLRSLEQHSVTDDPIKTTVTYVTKDRDLEEFSFTQDMRNGFTQPLVVAYSAARHAPYMRSESVSDQDDPTASLFHPEIELVDAVRILESLDYGSLREKEEKSRKSRSKISVNQKENSASRLYNHIKEALAKILPEVRDQSRIHIYGPGLPGQLDRKTGVWLTTYSGEVPFNSLSIGYRTMFAWVVDLAWRMAEHHRKSADPLREPAIVLIDELDLHLHPRWQRRIRRDLSEVFPKVQFVVTTHSPVLAQTYLDTNIAVIRSEGDHAIIDNDPEAVQSWRLDQVSVSLLRDQDPYAPKIVEAFDTRRQLLQKKRLTATEKSKLEAANRLVAKIPSSEDSETQKASDLIRQAALLIATREQ